MRVVAVGLSDSEVAGLRDARPAASYTSAADVTAEGLLGARLEPEHRRVQTRGWLDQMVPLPGGYRTSRRDVLKVVSLGGALSSAGVLLTRSKARPRVLVCAAATEAAHAHPPGRRSALSKRCAATRAQC